MGYDYHRFPDAGEEDNNILVDDDDEEEEEEEELDNEPDKLFEGDDLPELPNYSQAEDAGEEATESYWRINIIHSVERRAPLLLILLVLQSTSSYILEAFSDSIITHHQAIVIFLTMIVGTGGNAGGQSAASVLQGMASGDIQLHQAASIVYKEFLTACLLSIIVGYIGYFRCRIQGQTPLDSFVIAVTLCSIVITSILVGTMLPICFEFSRRIVKRRFGEKWASFLDPANTTFPAFQVIMDILGIMITVAIAYTCYYIIFTGANDTYESNVTSSSRSFVDCECDCATTVYVPLF